MEGFTVVRIPRGASRRFVSFLALFLSALLLTACSSYGERVAPVPLPESRADAVDVDGAKLIAQAYVDPDQAKAALGFDARGAGLLPVRFVVDNKSGKTVSVDPSQTFLVDNQGNAWPLLTSDQAYQRVKSNVSVGSTLSGGAKSSVLLGAAGAVAGFAVGVLTGQNIAETAGKGAVAGASVGAIAGGAKANQELGDRIRGDLARESLQNQRIGNGQLAYGYLFFPGKDEAKSAKMLRLAVQVGGRMHVVNLPL